MPAAELPLLLAGAGACLALTAAAAAAAESAPAAAATSAPAAPAAALFEGVGLLDAQPRRQPLVLGRVEVRHVVRALERVALRERPLPSATKTFFSTDSSLAAAGRKPSARQHKIQR